MKFISRTLWMAATMLAIFAVGQEEAPPAAPGVPEETAVTDVDGVAESLLLLQHLLQTAHRNGEIEARYAAAKRAQQIYAGVELRLTPSQRRTWSNRKRLVFQQLPLPEVVRATAGPAFHRVAGRRGVVYVSEAVTRGDYAAFLTARKIGVDRIRGQFYQMPFLQGEDNMVTCVDREAPVSGLSQHAAEAYRQWLAKHAAVTLRIPLAGDLPPGLRRSMWIGNRWVEPDPERAELMRAYGGTPVTLLLETGPVGEFPEATVPGVELHLTMSATDARRLQLANTSEVPGQ